MLFPDAVPMRGILIAYDNEVGYYDAPFDFHWWLWRSADNTVLDSFKALELALFQNPVYRFDLPPLAQCSISFLDGKDVRGISPVELLKSPKTTDLIYIKGLTLAFQPQ